MCSESTSTTNRCEERTGCAGNGAIPPGSKATTLDCNGHPYWRQPSNLLVSVGYPATYTSGWLSGIERYSRPCGEDKMTWVTYPLIENCRIASKLMFTSCFSFISLRVLSTDNEKRYQNELIRKGGSTQGRRRTARQDRRAEIEAPPRLATRGGPERTR